MPFDPNTGLEIGPASDWKQGLFGCCKDPKGDCYACYCSSCMITSIVKDLDLPSSHQCSLKCCCCYTIAQPGFICGRYCACCPCGEYTAPCWYTTVLEKVTEKYNLKPQSPLANMKCCKASCTYCNPLVCLIAPCSLCSIYQEVKQRRPAAGVVTAAADKDAAAPVVGTGAAADAPAQVEMSKYVVAEQPVA